MSEEKIVVVYLDDEQDNLDVFSLNVPDNIHLKCYTNPQLCLEEIKELNPWIIVSDQRMPLMSGVEFLKATKTICPQSIRLMITAYSDEDVPAQLINHNAADGYIKKPWDGDQLVELISKYLDVYAERNIVSKFKAIYGSTYGDS